MFGQRGQEAAPFELLVAVIIMTFVILIGTHALATMQEEKCKGEIEASIEQMRIAIERVTTGKGKQSLNFSPPSCFKEENTTIKIIESHEPDTCAAYCGGGQSRCLLLIYDAMGEFSSWKCLKISPLTQFLGSADCPDEAVAPNYYAVDLRNPGSAYKDSIPTGHYIIEGKFHAMSSFPILCAYHYEQRGD